MTDPQVPLTHLVEYLDSYLRIREIPDDAAALNGLQVQNSGQISRVVAAVDATEATILGLGAPPPGIGHGPMAAGPLLLVHHGLFWDGNQPVTSRRYRRLRALLARNAAVYSAHIPLDVHPEVGNNAALARRLSLTSTAEFGNYKGIALGVAGEAPPNCRDRDALARVLAAALAIPPEAVRTVPGGSKEVGRVGIITGGAGSMIGQAHLAGCDTFITGEGSAHHFHDAMELGVNVLFAGHYATETVGVQALAEHLAGRFQLPWAFHDHPTGM
jgi:dinuclear metal center YbgI/SA1388 family protein